MFNNPQNQKLNHRLEILENLLTHFKKLGLKYKEIISDNIFQEDYPTIKNQEKIRKQKQNSLRVIR